MNNRIKDKKTRRWTVAPMVAYLARIAFIFSIVTLQMLLSVNCQQNTFRVKDVTSLGQSSTGKEGAITPTPTPSPTPTPTPTPTPVPVPTPIPPPPPLPNAPGTAVVTWTNICDNSTRSCPNSSNTWSNVRGFLHVLPYDSLRREFLYLGAGPGHNSIYSNAIWGYTPSQNGVRGHMTLRVDTQLPATQERNDCPNYLPGGPRTSPILPNAITSDLLAGHPMGNAAFDTSRNKLYASGWLCANQYEPKTHSYNSLTASMEPSINVWESSSLCNWSDTYPYECDFGRTGQSWIYMPQAPSGASIDKVLVGLSNLSSHRLVEFNPVTKTYCVVGSTCAGPNISAEDGTPCTATTCPPGVLTNYGIAYNDRDHYVYIFGGCNGTSPGNASPNLCNGTNQNDLWKYDGELRRFYKVNPVGGIKPPNTNTSSPFFAFDTRRNRALYYGATDTLYQYDVTTNAWTVVNARNSSFAYTPFIGGHCDGCVAGYDPASDTMVLILGGDNGQSEPPTIWEAYFGP